MTPVSPVVIGNRRFTCLAPGLVRLEFDPAGRFEDRRSLVAAGERQSTAFRDMAEANGVTRLETGMMTIVTRENDKAFFPSNVEIHWMRGGLLQLWRPGDVDYENLGGTVRSLDVFDRYANLDGVHRADMEPPDAKANVWNAWNICETDPWFYKQSGREGIGFDLHRCVVHAPDRVLVRTANHARDQYRYSPGILSRSGYFFLNDSLSAVLNEQDTPVERNTPGTQDWYFFVYDTDYKQALANWILLSGRAPLPARNIFGLIFSRWPAYDEAEAKAIVDKFRQEAVPLSVLVLDMEWSRKGWCNWDWDSAMYPDPAAFFAWCHDHQLQVTLNVHPLHVREDDSHFAMYLEQAGSAAKVDEREDPHETFRKVDVDICKPREAAAFMRVCHDPIVEQGLDFWWVDGTQGSINGTCDQLVTSKVYFENVTSKHKRGMLLSRYGGLGTHRYGVFFTGDTHSEWEVLPRECEFNIRAGHLGLAYISHDIGGFSHPSTPLIDPIRYIRWLQFGVFNPVIRFHSCPGAGSRQPWDYGKENLAIAKRWLQFRNSLIPLIYTAARHHYDTGVPIVRGLFLEYPHDPKAYRFDEFFFGDALLVAPVLTMDDHRDVYLPEGDWIDYATGGRLAGGQSLDVHAKLDTVPLYIRSGSVLVRNGDSNNPMTAHVSNLLLEVFPGGDGESELYEDDGCTPDYENGGFCRTAIRLTDDGESLCVILAPEAGSPLEASRELTLEVVVDAVPARVALNGVDLPVETMRYTPGARRCSMQLGSIDCRAVTEVLIRRAE